MKIFSSVEIGRWVWDGQAPPEEPIVIEEVQGDNPPPTPPGKVMVTYLIAEGVELNDESLPNITSQVISKLHEFYNQELAYVRINTFEGSTPDRYGLSDGGVIDNAMLEHISMMLGNVLRGLIVYDAWETTAE